MRKVLPNLVAKIDKSIWVLQERKKLVPTWYEALDRMYTKSSKEWMMFRESLQGIYKIPEYLNLPLPVFLILNQVFSTIEPTLYKNPDPVLSKFIDWYGRA